MGAGIRLASDAGMLNGVTPPDTDEGQKLRDLRREINEAYRAQNRSEALRQAVAEAAARLPEIKIPYYAPAGDAADRSLVVCIADCHYGAEWNVRGLRDETLNAYSPEIFERRMALLLRELVTILEKEGLCHVALLLCGDALDGMLRSSQLMRLRWGVVESCMRYAEYMARWVSALALHANIDVYGVDGNHSEIRPLGSKKGEFENENLEKIILWHMAERLRGVQTVRVNEQVERRKLVRVQGYSILLSHDTDTASLENAAKQAMLLYNERIDFMICGHKHRERELISGYTASGNALLLRVPSICGMDDYAQRLGYGGQPGATAMVLEKGYGRRCVYPILLTEREDADV